MKKEILDELTVNEIKTYKKRVFKTSIVLVIICVILFFVLLALFLTYLNPFTESLIKLQQL